MRLKPLLYGLATYLPGASRLHRRGTGGTDTARYCYAVWLRHLVMAAESGLPTDPRTVAELGPGDSLGIGLAALLSGVARYHALDVVAYAGAERNAAVLDELIVLYRARAPIPDDAEFPLLLPRLESYAFPHHLLSQERLQAALKPARLERLRHSLLDINVPGSMIRYVAPWQRSDAVQASSVDALYSQAVLEHVDDLPGTYRALWAWLRPGGWASHTLDYKSHGLARTWDGHRAASELTWRLVRGRRPYLLNRQLHSVHLDLMRQAGFEIVRDVPGFCQPQTPRRRHSLRIREALARSPDPEQDLRTSEAFVLARKVVE